MLRKYQFLVLYACFISFFLSFQAAAQTNYDFTNNGGDNDWSNSENWSPTGIPASSDTATIATGDSVVVNSDVTADSISLAGGIINCLAKLTVNSGMDFRGGDLRGSDTLVIASGATLAFTSSTFK
ncbi:MAG: hypothetical protein AAFP70_17125, partial [Calditrichota bacterium]